MEKKFLPLAISALLVGFIGPYILQAITSAFPTIFAASSNPTFDKFKNAFVNGAIALGAFWVASKVSSEVKL